MQRKTKEKNNSVKCISCEYAVMSVKNTDMCKCWKVEPAKRELQNAMVEHKCNLFKYGVMHNLRIRIGWKP